MPRRWVLVVDDDPMMLDMMETMLACPEFTVTTATDAKQSFIQARDLMPVLVISDLQMPGFGTGDQALKELRKDPRIAKIPFIFVSGMELAQVQALLPAGDPSVRFLQKPVDWDKLKALIAELTGLKVAGS
jgi:CheY-like chemotaxis protein